MLKPSLITNCYSQLANLKPSLCATSYSLLANLKPSQLATRNSQLANLKPSQLATRNSQLANLKPSQLANRYSLFANLLLSQLANRYSLIANPFTIDTYAPAYVTSLLRIAQLLLIVLFLSKCSPPGAARTEALRSSLEPHARELLEEAQASLQNGQLDRALALADSVERYSPELADIPFLRANAHFSARRYEEAEASFRRTLELDPEYAGAHRRLGDLEAQQGLEGDGLPYYLAEAELHPGTDLYTRIGRIYLEAGLADSARWALDRAIALDSTNASAYLQYGQLLEQLGKIDEALVFSQKAVALEPNTPNYQFVVGAQLFRSGSVEESISHLQSAADAQPLHYPAQYNLGQALLRLGQDEAARHYFSRADTARVIMDQINLTQQAIARQPNQAGNWNRLGQLYMRVDMHTSAENAFATALRVDPGNPEAQHGMARYALATGQANDAVRRFKLMLVSDRNRADIWLELALAHAAAGQCDEARKALSVVQELEPIDTSAKNRLGGLCQGER